MASDDAFSDLRPINEPATARNFPCYKAIGNASRVACVQDKDEFEKAITAAGDLLVEEFGVYWASIIALKRVNAIQRRIKVNDDFTYEKVGVGWFVENLEFILSRCTFRPLFCAFGGRRFAQNSNRSPTALIYYYNFDILLSL
ncbi:hypothetical protein F4680DRAFT_446995 [Xylaria scruposa]|nr:hypothetical protein F4680DRAFT_446995 [Xylaria scruposa]